MYDWSPNSPIATYDLYNFRGFLTVNPTPAPGWSSGRCGAQLSTVNGDFAGNDLTNVPAADALACSYKCKVVRECLAFSWSNHNGGTCWMKRTRPAMVSAPFDGSVVSAESFKCAATQWGTDIVSHVGGDRDVYAAGALG